MATPVKRKRPPMQPVIQDDKGVFRFQANKVVEYLLDQGGQHGLDMNHLASVQELFPRGDREQFAQLIGYSLSGFSELSYARDETVIRAEGKAEQIAAAKPRKAKKRSRKT